jgi:DNA repair photolyase
MRDFTSSPASIQPHIASLSDDWNWIRLAEVMRIRKVYARSILTRTRIRGIDYCLNPYVGCGHGCRYCYATFMKKFTGHDDAWGTFVDVKVNAADLLKKALRRARKGEVIVSSVTDPYQPVEGTYRLTRACLELLTRSTLSISILTKSDLVVRDIDLLRKAENVEVGLTITTDSERMRKVFEPGSSSIKARIEALRRMHEADIPTYVFVGPILPMNPDRLADSVAPFANSVLVDRMNYAWKVSQTYSAHRLDYALEDAFFEEMECRLVRHLSKLGINTKVV